MTRAITATLVASLLLPIGAGAAGPARYPHEQMSRWGQWGADDEKGAANFLTAERVVAAAMLIQKGSVFSLAIPLDETGPVFPGRLSPHHTMVLSGADYSAGMPPTFGDMNFADDYIYMPLQGSTQWDALSHGWYGETLYNGVPQNAIRTSPAAGGATRLGIENIKDSMVGRGVLIDVLRHKGGTLPPGYTITRADLEAALAKQGTEVRQGDIVVVRTGFVPAFYEISDPIERMRYVAGPQTGVGPDVIPWVKEMKITGLAADNLALEVLPPPSPELGLGVHGNLLRDLGVYIGEIWWLEDLAEDCAKDGRYDFFLAAQPLNLTGAVGSPLNPVAIK